MAAIAKKQSSFLRERSVDADGALDHGHVGGVFLPLHIDDVDRLQLAGHARLADRTRAQHARVGEHLQRAGRRDDLLALGQRRHARGGVHRVAVDVAVFDQRIAVMQADADGELVAREVDVVRDAFLHVHRAEQTLHRPGKRAHDFIADGLDDPPAVALRDLRERTQNGCDQPARFDVSPRFEQLGTSADVGEQDGQGLAFGHQGE